jgi:hypothetical protein
VISLFLSRILYQRSASKPNRGKLCDSVNVTVYFKIFVFPCYIYGNPNIKIYQVNTFVNDLYGCKKSGLSLQAIKSGSVDLKTKERKMISSNMDERAMRCFAFLTDIVNTESIQSI